MFSLDKTYDLFMQNLAEFPISFRYGAAAYRGLSPTYFTEISRKTERFPKKEVTEITLTFQGLEVQVKGTRYFAHNAYEYTLSFTNNGKEKSDVFSEVQGMDAIFVGKNAHLKGIMGDFVHQFAPYDKDLAKEPVHFANDSGRPTHVTFPYFNLQTERGGAMLALGWAGTWQADFVYDQTAEAMHFTGQGTLNLATYLKPGERLAFPVIGVLCYGKEEENNCTNLWRKWLIDCILPRDHKGATECAQPFSTVYHAFDNEARFRTDGSTAENYLNWEKSVFAAYEKGLVYDVQWFDAGWYIAPDGTSPETDWWGTVGTWELDPVKWPQGTFERRVAIAHENGQKFMVWFEPERVTHPEELAKNYGYNPAWALSENGKNNAYINNLGNKDCLEWTKKRILAFFEKYDTDIYREDFNIDPAGFWAIGDGLEGENRKGITENLYVQGHFALWDAILEWAAAHGKPTFIDSCASGGGRNDFDTIHRSIPINRSDADRFTSALRLSLTPRLAAWLPCNGAVAKDAEQLTDNSCDLYALRASYLCVYQPAANFYLDNAVIDWDCYRKGWAEWKQISPYLLKDFYPLTPDHGPTENSVWTAYLYFDEEKNEGALQAFRPSNCQESSYTVRLKGVKANCNYTVVDVDGKQTIASVSGKELQNGLTLLAESPRTAIILYIKPLA